MKIAVVGSMNIDKVATVDHIPLKGETLLATDYMETFGGKGANQAVAIARLGGDVTMFGCVGDDGDGIRTIEHMSNEGIGMTHVRSVKGVPTGCAFINVGEGDNVIVVVSGANSHVTIEYLDSVREQLSVMDIILLQNEIPAASVEYLLKTYGHSKKCVIYNPAPYRKISREVVIRATYITPNENEATELAEVFNSDLLMDQWIITKGSAGVQCFINGEVRIIPAIPCTPVDTTGAGDTFNGAFAYAISKQMPLAESLRLANAAAGLSTEKKGAQEGMPSAQEVNARLY